MIKNSVANKQGEIAKNWLVAYIAFICKMMSLINRKADGKSKIIGMEIV